VNSERNPQAQQMGDESMVRNLAFQAQAIWPQEELLFARYRLAGPLRILDLGCGHRRDHAAPRRSVSAGAGHRRRHSRKQSRTRARRESRGYSDRVGYEAGDAFALKFADAHFDLVVCRHMSQSVPDFTSCSTRSAVCCGTAAGCICSRKTTR
jgi:ubiquinone/menaquinone biosynthesis C-methylase UbiE